MEQGVHIHRVPWISILIFIFAGISVFIGDASSDGGEFIFLAHYWKIILNFAGIGAIAIFCVGLARFFVSADQTKKNSGVHLMLWALLAIVIVVGCWFFISLLQRTFSVESNRAILPMAIPQFAERDSSSAQIPQRYAPDAYFGGNQIPATDTREFLKTNYNATLKTQKVSSLTRSVETIVRGHEGRVDHVSVSDRVGYVSFAIPSSEFQQFREEIEGLVGERFLAVSMNSQNLLSQKRNIEADQRNVETDISTLTAQKKKIIVTHTANVAELQKQIDDNTFETAVLNEQVSKTTDENAQSQMLNRLYQLTSELASLKTRLSRENSTYANELASIDFQLKNENTDLSNVKQQDKNFMDMVETVQGTITLKWISYPAIAKLYLPGFWIPGILCLLGIIVLWFERRPRKLA